MQHFKVNYLVVIWLQLQQQYLPGYPVPRQVLGTIYFLPELILKGIAVTLIGVGNVAVFGVSVSVFWLSIWSCLSLHSKAHCVFGVRERATPVVVPKTCISKWVGRSAKTCCILKWGLHCHIQEFCWVGVLCPPSH